MHWHDVAHTEDESFGGASVGVAVGEGSGGVVVVGDSGAASVLLDGEGAEHVVHVHEGHEAVLPEEVEGEVVVFVAHAQLEAGVDATEVLEGAAVVLVGGEEGVVVGSGLGHAGGDLAILVGAEEAKANHGAGIEVEVVLGLCNGQFPTPGGEDGDFGIVVVEIAVAIGALEGADVFEVGAATGEVEAELEVEVVGPEGLCVLEAIVDEDTQVASHDGGAGEEVVGHVGGTETETDAVVGQLGLCAVGHQEGCDEQKECFLHVLYDKNTSFWSGVLRGVVRSLNSQFFRALECGEQRLLFTQSNMQRY